MRLRKRRRCPTVPGIVAEWTTIENEKPNVRIGEVVTTCHPIFSPSALHFRKNMVERNAVPSLCEMDMSLHKYRPISPSLFLYPLPFLFFPPAFPSVFPSSYLQWPPSLSPPLRPAKVPSQISNLWSRPPSLLLRIGVLPVRSSFLVLCLVVLSDVDPPSQPQHPS